MIHLAGHNDYALPSGFLLFHSMTAIKISVAALTGLLSWAGCHAADTTDSTIRQQADSFLQAMPDSLQFRQAQAVSRAIAGDNSDLRLIRASRDKAPAISPEVKARDLSPDLRLYEPVAATDTAPLPLLIYFHGGGWTFGSINSCGLFCDAMAATGMLKVLAVNYRLAPEHPYPDGYNDCIEAVRYAMAHSRELGVDCRRIAVGGDSSGGNLAAATALSPECAGSIESLVLFYPVTKAFADGSESWDKFGEGYGLDSQLMEQFNRAYNPSGLTGITTIDVGLAPQDDIDRLPRTLLIAAGRDILRDQGLEFADRFPADRLTRIEFTDAVHLFITVPGQDEAFRRSVLAASRFIASPKHPVSETDQTTLHTIHDIH